MNAEMRRSGDATVLSLGGRLTGSAAGRIRELLLEAFSGSRRVELALRGVEEPDLTFLQLLCAAHRTAAARSVSFAVTGLEGEPALIRLLQESGASPGAGCPPECPLARAEGVAAPVASASAGGLP